MIHVNRFLQDRYFLSGGLHGMLAVGTLTGAVCCSSVMISETPGKLGVEGLNSYLTTRGKPEHSNTDADSHLMHTIHSQIQAKCTLYTKQITRLS